VENYTTYLRGDTGTVSPYYSKGSSDWIEVSSLAKLDKGVKVMFGPSRMPGTHPDGTVFAGQYEEGIIKDLKTETGKHYIQLQSAMKILFRGYPEGSAEYIAWYGNPSLNDEGPPLSLDIQ
jgi:hypothetical protein